MSELSPIKVFPDHVCITWELARNATSRPTPDPLNEKL